MRIDRLIEIFNENPAGLTKTYIDRNYPEEETRDVSDVLRILVKQKWVKRIPLQEDRTRHFRYYYWRI